MENNPALDRRTLINKKTFRRNYSNQCENQTYLCYEVEVWESNVWTPVMELQGFLRKMTHGEHRHEESCCLYGNNPRKRYPRAELCFLALFPSWRLDNRRQYRVTWYSSWSPYPDCVPRLVEFLRENSHVELRIFVAGIHSLYSGYKRELRNLQAAGAKLAIMTLKEFQHCWKKFVNSQDKIFQTFPNQKEHINTKKQKLNYILESGKLKDGLNLSKPAGDLLVKEE